MPTKSTRKIGENLPAPTKVHMPAGYTPHGTKPNFLAWEWVTERLERSHSYWICSTRPDGRPHAAPVWGVWMDGAVVFSTDPSSRKAQNLKAFPGPVGLYRLKPAKVMAWREKDFISSATKWNLVRRNNDR
jgi:hypothetical protein